MSRYLGLPCLLLATAWAAAGCSPSAGECEPGHSYTCYPGADGTIGVGDCHAGTLVCNARGQRGECVGAVIPAPELCDGRDNNCDGTIDEDVTNGCGGCSVLEHNPGDLCPTCG